MVGIWKVKERTTKSGMEYCLSLFQLVEKHLAQFIIDSNKDRLSRAFDHIPRDMLLAKLISMVALKFCWHFSITI